MARCMQVHKEGHAMLLGIMDVVVRLCVLSTSIELFKVSRHSRFLLSGTWDTGSQSSSVVPAASEGDLLMILLEPMS